MPDMLKCTTRREAWIRGVRYLLDHGSDLDLVLAIAEPGADELAHLAVSQRVDDFLRTEREHPLHTVAETIFPGWEYSRRGLRGVFDLYAEQEYPAFKAREPQRWGTYAHRLVRRVGRGGRVVNPLQRLIDKLKKEKGVKGPKSACYELGVAEGAYDLPLYNTVDDDNRHMGGPCLSHLSFKLFQKKLHLAAFYRSHDYRYKALGNLLGLARLQACVAHESGLPLGTLTVHSSYAWLGKKKGATLRRLRDLLSDIEELEKEADDGLVR